MTRKRRTYNVRHIRRDYSYTIQELSELFSLHKNAVGQWLKAGLKPIDRSRPILIHGSDIMQFLKSRQSDRRTTCQPDEFFCFRCRVPRLPLGRRVDVQPRNAKLLNLVAVCAECSTTMRKVGSAKKRAFYCQLFSAATPAPPHISETPNPNDNRDLTREK